MALLIVTMIKGSFLDPEDLFLMCPRPLTLSEDQLIHLSLFPFNMITLGQGCISCGILVSGIRARGVSSGHMENMEMFSCSPT